MDIARYKELKKKNLITMQKVGPAIIVVKRKWDPENGRELDPEVMNPNSGDLAKRVEDLIDQRNILTQNIEALQEFLKDIQELNKVSDLNILEKAKAQEPAEGE